MFYVVFNRESVLGVFQFLEKIRDRLTPILLTTLVRVRSPSPFLPGFEPFSLIFNWQKWRGGAYKPGDRSRTGGEADFWRIFVLKNKSPQGMIATQAGGKIIRPLARNDNLGAIE